MLNYRRCFQTLQSVFFPHFNCDEKRDREEEEEITFNE